MEKNLKSDANISHLKKKLLNNRAAFSHYNMVRMREALRYLSSEKVTLFTRIPFLIHMNEPQLPGYVKSQVPANGIWNFEQTGFYKEAVKSKGLNTDEKPGKLVKPAVLGLYHIGSLGTFTQSIGSDFDFWVIIDNQQFSQRRFDTLEEKLAAIQRYSREKYAQKVTFFVMDKEDLKHNYYGDYKKKETLLAPKLFLKEEFYRTFLMIAGKIPYWAILPPKISTKKYNHLVSTVLSHEIFRTFSDSFIDLGHVDSIDWPDILKGLSWHICKSRSDPVKALIKATMVISYGFDNPGGRVLLCDEIKSAYAGAGIDDYRTDPYKILFDRLILFHQKNDAAGLNLIKNAIFFRLCGYPKVARPEKGSPKQQLLDRFIRHWHLKPAQIAKLLSYTSWPESEKLLLENTLLNRLKVLNELAMKQKDIKIHIEKGRAAEERNWQILQNKTKERVRESQKKISDCSTFLRANRAVHHEIHQQHTSRWCLYSLTSEDRTPDRQIYSNHCFLGIMGWMAHNLLYDRSNTRIKVNHRLSLFENTGVPVNPDRIYLSLQPLKPLSDEIFEHPPEWKKVVILLIHENTHPVNRFKKAEILVTNSWGEIFLESMDLDALEKTEAQYHQIVHQIRSYTLKKMRLFIFQLSDQHDPDIATQLKLRYERRVKQNPPPGKATGPKPYLDML